MITQNYEENNVGEQGWRSGGAFASHAGLPPMWPGFDSQTRRQMWVEFVVGSHPCSERFFSGYSGFPLSSKTNISKFQFDLESEGHRFVSHQDYYVPPLLNKVYLFSFYFVGPFTDMTTIKLLKC